MSEILASGLHPPRNDVDWVRAITLGLGSQRTLSWTWWDTDKQVPWPQKPDHFEEELQLMAPAFWAPGWLEQPVLSLPAMATAEVVKMPPGYPGGGEEGSGVAIIKLER